MSNREIVIGLLDRLPADTSLAEIAHVIEFLAGIKNGSEQADRGEGIAAEEARQLVNAWTTRQ